MFRSSTASPRWGPQGTPTRPPSSPVTAKGRLAERTAEFDAIWRAIGEGIRSLRLDLRRVNLYQDSLPVCGHERALVHEMAMQGSRNHQLLEALADSGASLIGTESPALLLEEYRLVQSSERTETEAAALLDARDRLYRRSHRRDASGRG